MQARSSSSSSSRSQQRQLQSPSWRCCRCTCTAHPASGLLSQQQRPSASGGREGPVGAGTATALPAAARPVWTQWVQLERRTGSWASIPAVSRCCQRRNSSRRRSSLGSRSHPCRCLSLRRPARGQRQEQQPLPALAAAVAVGRRRRSQSAVCAWTRLRMGQR